MFEIQLWLTTAAVHCKLISNQCNISNCNTILKEMFSALFVYMVHLWLIYEGWLISLWSKIEGVSLRKSNAVIFNIVPSYINTLSSSVMEQTDPCCVEGIIISGKMMTTELLFHFLVRGNSRRQPNQENRCVFNKMESTFVDSSHGHFGCVCRSIVLVEEQSSCQLSTPNRLDFLP